MPVCLESRERFGRAGRFGTDWGLAWQIGSPPAVVSTGALGLVVNIIVLWNTIYMEAALDQLRREGYPVRDQDVAHLSPLIYDHINVLGRYSFAVPESVARGELRPLRNPADDDA